MSVNEKTEKAESNPERNQLIEQVFDAIMLLTEKERKSVLSKYAERHGLAL